MRARRRVTGAWGIAALEASLDREDAIRASRPVQPSSSRVPHRCATCHEWTAPTPAGRCPVCGDWWEGEAHRGLERVVA